jgi:uncharacterized protein YciI
MFVLILKYSYGIDIVYENLELHKEFLDKYYSSGKFICSGPQIPRTGGIIFCNAKDREEVTHIIAEDPFYFNKAVEYEIIEFNANNYADGFEKFVHVD